MITAQEQKEWISNCPTTFPPTKLVDRLT